MRSSAAPGGAVALLTGFVVLAAAGGGGAPSVCESREQSCSGHGACNPRSRRPGVGCRCDASYHGDRCDVWRAPPRPDLLLLQDVDWENCTHGWRPGGNGSDSVMLQLCETLNKTVCEAAGAPTVPPPNFTSADCYQKPQTGPPPTVVVPSSQRAVSAPCAAALMADCDVAKSQGLSQCVQCVGTNAADLTSHNCSSTDQESYCASPGPNHGSPICPDFKGIPTVLHGVKGSFCARPCVTKQSASCEDCPWRAHTQFPPQHVSWIVAERLLCGYSPPGDGACPCQVKDKNGTCLFCSGECKAEGHLPAVIVSTLDLHLYRGNRNLELLPGSNSGLRLVLAGPLL